MCNYQGGLINLPHTFRATGIITYLENGGELEVAQRLASRTDAFTTKLYDRCKGLVSKKEMV